MRKLKIFTLLAAAFTALIFVLNIYADNVDVTMNDTVSIRTSGEQGLRFQATISGNYDKHEHGFYVIYGRATISDLINAKKENNPNINGKDYKKVTVGGVDANNNFAVILIGIPEQGYEDEITVVSYIVKGSTEVYSETPTTRNVVDVAVKIYNTQPPQYSGEFKSLIDSIASNKIVKVIHFDNSISYFNDLNNIDLSKGDQIYLSRGTFNSSLLINKDNVSIYGTNKDIKVNNNGERESSLFEESIYNATGGIEIEKDIKNIIIKGLTFTANRAVIFNGNNDNILIENNLIKVTGNYGIRDQEYATYNENDSFSNINIIGNYFSSSAQSFFRDLYFFGFVETLNVYDNFFTNHRNTISGSDYAIRTLRYSKGSEIDIYNNSFNKYGASYIIDIGYLMGSSNIRQINNDLNLNIEKNTFSESSEKTLAGSGIRAAYIGDNSTITILNNSNMRISPYYNTIMLSGGYHSDYDDKVENVKVEILYNMFYASKIDEVPKPSSRNEQTTRFTRIGLGLPVYSDIKIDSNYYSNSTSRYAFTNNTSDAPTKNNNQTVLTTNKVDNSTQANNLYNNYLNDFSNRINSYLLNSPFNNVSSAHYFGLENRDIKNYISNFSNEDINLIEIHDDQLTYVGRQLYYRRLSHQKDLNEDLLHGIYRPEDLVVNIAYIFLAQGTQIQYDQGSGRRMLGVKPEYATDEKEYFTDCSGFIADVYQSAFGLDVYPGQTTKSTNTRSYVDYAKNNQDKSNVITYVSTSSYSTTKAKQDKLDELYKLLVPGDVIIYRYSNSSAGHSMLYVGNDKIIHVTGASYDYDLNKENYEPNGAIEEFTASDLFYNIGHLRYLFRPSNNEFAILRPLSGNEVVPTPYGLSRNMVRGLDVEKKANIGVYSGVSVGDILTYTLTLKNASNAPLKGFYVRSNLSTNETFVSVDSNGVRNGNEINFYIDNIQPNQTRTFTYQIQVKKSSSSPNELVSGKTTIFDIEFNQLHFSIVDYTPSQLNEFNNKINNAEGSTRNLKQLLEYLYGVNHPIVGSTLAQVYDNEDLRPRNLWGGRLTDRSQDHNNPRRTRFIKDSYLIPGDIIISQTDDVYTIYIYSNDKILTHNVNTNRTSSINLDFDKLLSTDRYRTFRPTFILV